MTTTTCPYCQGGVEVTEAPRRLEQTTPTHRIVEHLNFTNLRCEGSFAEVTPTTTHRCPLGDDGVTPCCRRSPLELPTSDRMTVDDDLVTCR